jgi:Fe-S-cluster containining protein
VIELEQADCFYAEGLRFSCKRCSGCCRVEPGYVFLSQNDVELLSCELKMKTNEFEQVYCRSVDVGDGMEQLSLKETSANDCIFWKTKNATPSLSSQDGGCSVYHARPFSCRSYPFWASMLTSQKIWQETSAYCPGCGTGQLHDKAEIEAALEIEQKNPLIKRPLQRKRAS